MVAKTLNILVLSIPKRIFHKMLFWAGPEHFSKKGSNDLEWIHSMLEWIHSRLEWIHSRVSKNALFDSFATRRGVYHKVVFKWMSSRWNFYLKSLLFYISLSIIAQILQNYLNEKNVKYTIYLLIQYHSGIYRHKRPCV